MHNFPDLSLHIYTLCSSYPFSTYLLSIKSKVILNVFFLNYPLNLPISQGYLSVTLPINPSSSLSVTPNFVMYPFKNSFWLWGSKDSVNGLNIQGFILLYKAWRQVFLGYFHSSTNFLVTEATFIFTFKMCSFYSYTHGYPLV